MMSSQGKIRVLPERVANLIAAGEVVERPASVIKELVENSLDAGAQKIEIIYNGKENILVVDDGEGMNKIDALNSFKRYATSKISTEQDIYSVKTFGFRGEALHSIAAVSRVILRTKRKEDELGTEVSVEGGKVKEIKEIYIEPGTSILVKDLFFNTPARKKFLSSDNVELSYVLDVVSRYALAIPEINLKFIKGENVLFNLKAGRTLSETLLSIFGTTAVDKDRFEIMFDVGNITLEGIIWREKVGIGKWLFVNRRYIKDKTVFSAIGKFGFLRNSDFIIFINCPPQFYDVNVNPTKTEIRWRSPSQVREIVMTAIEEAIRHRFRREKTEVGQGEFSNYSDNKVSEMYKSKSTESGEISQDQDYVQRQKKQEYPPGVMNTLLRSSPNVLKVVKGIFAIVEWEEEIYIVDLHAYYEGKFFSQLKSKFENNKQDSSQVQKLKFVIPYELSVPKTVLLKIIEKKDEFKSYGIEFDVDGEKLKIFSIPYYLAGVELAEFFEEFSDGFTESKVNSFLASLACRTVIRKGDNLSVWDVAKILEDFDPNQRCPHGRPAVIKIDFDEIQKKFGRC